MTEVEVIDLKAELQVFNPVAAQIEAMKAKNASIVFDYEDKEGNKNARSHIATLRKLKKPINETHKLAKAEAKKFCDALDGKKRELIGVVEEMIKVHHEPIWKIEQREMEIQAEKELEKKRIDEEAEAARVAEIEAREKKLADEEAKLQASRAEYDHKEHERKMAEKWAREAEENAKQAGIDAENRRLADVQREKDKAAAEAARVKRVAEEGERRKDAEVLAAKNTELARIEQEKADDDARKSDAKHRSEIHRSIYTFYMTNTSLGKEICTLLTQALIDNKIPHTFIKY